ncbi:MAG: glutamyl-tRNA amidotransferase [Acidobacteria bacterium]|nr:glutamyl-tRNA amidotransferase [Acidobacteriota bacterium]MYF15340.1 glutamyl-tRNA amidotransferase [Acidobacteriota bacterium]MYI96856.1 glutamyl-tRNA amidotransferase [Acidobacteriota bacterium]
MRRPLPFPTLFLAGALAALALLFAARSDAGQSREIELTTATIAEINEAVDAGVLTAERLVELCLARIAAYDDQGPRINAVISVNPNARQRAREMDAERERSGRRSPLHGIPVLLKDNFDTADIPTTAGSFLLQDSRPPDDAFVVRKLREAGAIVLAKVNLSEFASGGAMSSLGGITRNPHDPTRTPAGSSGGTGAAVAAGYGFVGLGSDTGGSIRGPSTANGLAGLKPTLGLLSRDGIVPLALSFDTGGPMARSVYDVAVSLGTMVGVDEADAATSRSAGQFHDDYTQFLDAEALSGARLGVARDFMGTDREVDWAIEAALDAMRDAGAEVVDVRFPEWLLEVESDFYLAVRWPEFRKQIAEYLQGLGDGYPRTLDELVERSMRLPSHGDGLRPNPGRWSLFLRENASGEVTDHAHIAVREHALPLVRALVEGLMDQENLDAIAYPTSPTRPALLDRPPDLYGPSPVRLANMSGFPDLIVPAGFTGGGLPVGISFLGRAFSEPRLLALGYAFEQRVRAHRVPAHTPPLPGERITIP